MSSANVIPAPHQPAAHSADQYRKILVASAGDPSSTGAIRVAAALAQRQDASVEVVAVTAPFPHAMPTGLQIAPPSLIDKANQQSVIELVRRQLAEVRGTDHWAIRATVGWPAESVVSVGQSWPASLIVMGLGKHGLANRLLGAETAVRVVRRSAAPVLAVPRDASRLPIRAVAAIDFTESSENAATLAAELLGPAGTLTLVHASVLVKEAPPAGSLPDLYTTGARDKLDAIRERVQRGTKRRVQSLLVNDEVVDGLLDYVDIQGCDLLALGGHDMGLVDRFLLGSVRSRILRHAQCAVLITPALHDAG